MTCDQQRLTRAEAQNLTREDLASHQCLACGDYHVAPVTAPNPSKPGDVIPPDIRSIGERLRTQDNLATEDPIFVVQHRVRDYGYDRSGGDDDVTGIIYISRDGDISISEADYDRYAAEGVDDEGENFNSSDWEEVSYRDRWEYVTACFTRAGAVAYLASNGHNLNETRIYVDTSYRNAEWIAVRKFLMELKP